MDKTTEAKNLLLPLVRMMIEQDNSMNYLTAPSCVDDDWIELL